MVTDEQRITFYRNKKKVGTAVLKQVKKGKSIIFGARAVNQQLRKPLEKHTEDFDIMSKTPKKTARKIEKRIDKRYGFNVAERQPAEHEGTIKVVNRVTKRGIADVSKTPKPSPKTIRRKGVRYAKNSFQLKKIKESLADPKSKFRHDKDRETRKRIELNERFKAKRRRKQVTKRVGRKMRRRGKGFIEQSRSIGTGNIKFMSPRF